MELIELCKQIGIEDEVQKKVLALSKSMDFKCMGQEIEQMMHPEFWEGTIEHLQDLLGPDEDGMKILTCQLQCACDCYSKYESLGITKEIFIATMKIFSRFLQDYKDRHGTYQYVWSWWTVRQISMTIYRIGELEYEMKIDNKNHLIDIHIPSDADMNTNKLRDSYLKALDFFRKYYPDYIGATMVCSSWLLAPSLKYVLSQNSRILQFQKAFDIEHVDTDNLGFMDWVYGSKDIPLEKLPEDTSLQRNIKHHLQNEGKVEWASGKLIANPFCES